MDNKNAVPINNQPANTIKAVASAPVAEVKPETSPEAKPEVKVKTKREAKQFDNRLKKKPADKKKRFGIVVFVLGLIALIGGAVFLILNITKQPDVRDADYLVQIKTWQREDAPAVIWQFNEIGKGKLTTNSHTDEYDFIWALDGDKLKIETSWLYTLDDEYTYTLDQKDNKLTITSGEKSYSFVPVASESSEEESTEEAPETEE